MADIELKTGVNLRLVGGTRLELGHEGVFLQSGHIMVSVKTRKSRFEVLTPLAQVGVRGTIFQVSHAKRTEIHVFEGLVRVDRRGERDSEVFLERGQWVPVLGRSGQRLEVLEFDPNNRLGFQPVKVEAAGVPTEPMQAEQLRLQEIQRGLERQRRLGEKAFVAQAGFPAPSMASKEIQVFSKPSYSPSDPDFRAKERDLEELRRGRIQPGANYIQDRRNLREEREFVSALSLKTRFQDSAIERSPSQGEANLGKRRIDEELRAVRSFISRSQLERRRLVQELDQVDRERQRISQKISSLESRLVGNTAPDPRTQTSLVSLRIQKRSLDQKRSSLVQRLSMLDRALDESRARIFRLLNSRSERRRADQDLVRDARRLLR